MVFSKAFRFAATYCLKRTTMKTVFIPLVLLAMASAAVANTVPTVVIQSAAMRPGTTLMDVVYRVNDPDDATVKTRALAFVDGERSFAKVLKPVTFAEGTAAKLGDAIPSNTDHTLTWDVGADWDIDLGQVKFEVLAMDGRGFLTFDWLTIPAAGGKPIMTISFNSAADQEVIDAFFWLFAAGDSGLTLTNGVVSGSVQSGIFSGVPLVSGSGIQNYAAPYLFKKMGLDVAGSDEVDHAAITARAGIANTTSWHAALRPYAGLAVLQGWGQSWDGVTTIPAGLTEVTAISVGQNFSLALKSDSTVVGWGQSWDGQIAIPASLTGVTAISAGQNFSLALKSNGTVVGWGSNSSGQITIPAGLTEVTAISAGKDFSLALKSNGTVVGWGSNSSGQTTIPAGLTGVTAISAGQNYSLALKSDGTVVGWGQNFSTQIKIPAGLTSVTAISAGSSVSLALKSDGSVVGWGNNSFGQITIPAGLTGVTAISAGQNFSLALKSDGTVVGWGSNSSGQITIPAGLTGVTAISSSRFGGFVIVLKAKGL
jgi:hypothetical protein